MTPREKTLANIREIVAPHGVSVGEVLSRSRTPHIVAARRAVAIHYRNAGRSFPEIGRIIGRDHTSVMNLVYGKSWKYMSRREDGLPQECMSNRGAVECCA